SCKKPLRVSTRTQPVNMQTQAPKSQPHSLQYIATGQKHAFTQSMKYLLVFMILLSRLEAAPRKIRFQGVVKQGERFQKTITRNLHFTLDPEIGGWTIEIEPTNKDKLGEEACTYFASIATPPFHFDNPRYIWPGYSHVKEVVQMTRREFSFV